MADGVLLDTSFLISFVDRTRKHHAVAVQFFKCFASEGVGQAKVQDIAFVITEDASSLHKFCRELQAQSALRTRAIKLEDGFDKSHFDATGQHDFDAGLGRYPPNQ
jgi:predicted nucleic acid-binding protein